MTVQRAAGRILCGVAAAAVAVGVAQLVAAPFGPAADALDAVGSAVVRLTPGPVAEWAIRRFGTADKLFLSVAVVADLAVVAAVAGLVEKRRVPAGSALLVLVGAVGGAAVLAQAGAQTVDVVPVVVGIGCGVVVLRVLTVKSVVRQTTTTAEPSQPSRRWWLAALGLLGLGLIAGVGGGALSRRWHSVAAERAAFIAPRVKSPPPPPPPQVQPTGVALPSYLTPNQDFYRIDTALSVPQLARADWRLKIHGMVDHELTYTFDDLQRVPAIEKTVTLTCVSNVVGGNLISNATWTGYRVRDLLAPTGIHGDADMVLSTAVDGFTIGTPLAALTDGRDALLAVTMNGEPLPTEHGYPARLVVPGLYGYVSATKWVIDLEVTRFDRAQAYWTQRGWAARAPIKTESRIDVPRSFQKVPAGPVRFGGVAWSQSRGVRAVEVRIDNEPWRPATLAANYSNDTWRLWSFDWVAGPPGSHTISVRATDNTGAVQTPVRAPTMPDGATGWHTVDFTVT